MKNDTRYQNKLLRLISDKESITVSEIQRRLNCSYLKACELLRWLKEKKIVGDIPKLLINKKEI